MAFLVLCNSTFSKSSLNESSFKATNQQPALSISIVWLRQQRRANERMILIAGFSNNRSDQKEAIEF